MVARFEELAAWQRSVELCEVVAAITEHGHGPAASDAEFQRQIRSAAQAAPSLIAEGFVRFTPGEIVRYLRMARGELGEVQSQLTVGRRMKYFSTEDAERAETLARRAMGTTTNLLKAKVRQLELQTRSKRRSRR